MGAAKFHLYTTLGVAKESTPEQVTRAYRKLALQYHPDRNPDGLEQFKAISNAYAILSDPDRRAVYDMTGFLSDPSSSSAAGAAADDMSDPAARQQRSSELAEQVRNFFATYAGSEEEASDVVKGYQKCNGDFRKMVREYLLFDNGVSTEVQRLHRLVDRLIAAGKLTATATYVETSTPRSILKMEKAMRREREEAEEALKELAGEQASAAQADGLGALQLAIQQRHAASYASMLDSLEAKYVRSAAEKHASGKRARGDDSTEGRGDKEGQKRSHQAEKRRKENGQHASGKRSKVK